MKPSRRPTEGKCITKDGAPYWSLKLKQRQEKQNRGDRNRRPVEEAQGR